MSTTTPTAADIVTRWSEDADLAIADLQLDPQSCEAALDALALRGAARRLADQGAIADRLGVLEGLIREGGADLIARALNALSPDGWRELCRDLCSEDGDLLPSEERLTRLLRLVLDLDAAQLVAWSARDLGSPDEALELELADCEALMVAERASFVDLAPALGAMLAAIRPDIDEVGPELALTVEKLRTLLGEAERAKAVVAYRCVPPLSQAEVAALSRAFGQS